ncbi:hypothetical protein IJU97_01365 [bacterium]|nr:hypothetical protein [bacterium]
MKLTRGFTLPFPAFSEIQTHQGYGPQSILDTLSKHSHAASSKVCPTLVTENPAKENLGNSDEISLFLLLSSSTR